MPHVVLRPRPPAGPSPRARESSSSRSPRRRATTAEIPQGPARAAEEGESETESLPATEDAEAPEDAEEQGMLMEVARLEAEGCEWVDFTTSVGDAAGSDDLLAEVAWLEAQGCEWVDFSGWQRATLQRRVDELTSEIMAERARRQHLDTSNDRLLKRLHGHDLHGVPVEELTRLLEELREAADRVAKRRDELLLSAAARDSLTCPITHQLMEEPVTCVDGHTYERGAIERWLRDHNTSPKTGLPLARRDLVPNFALRAAVEQYRTAIEGSLGPRP